MQREHAMVGYAIAFAAGIGVTSSFTQATATAITLVGLFAVAVCWRLRLSQTVFIATLLIWFAAGMVRAPARGSQHKAADGLVHVTGQVVELSLVRVPPSETRYGVAADYTKLRVNITSSQPPLALTHPLDCYVAGHLPTLDAGDEVQFVGRLLRRSPPANPGERWPNRSNEPFVRVEHPNSVQITPAHGLAHWRADVRRGSSDVIRSHLPPREAGLAETLLLGRRDELSRSLSDAFRQTGTGHLLAISGLHLGLIAWMLNAVIGRLTFSLRVRVWTVAVLVLGYACLVEPRASVIRAAVVALLASIAILNGRRVLTLPVLAAAAIVVLGVDPAQLTNAGAQLSFAAVTAIIAIVKFRVIERLTPSLLQADEMTPLRQLRDTVRPAYAFLLWGLLLWAATAPLAAYHFRWVTLWGALLHGLCFPLVAAAMACTLLALMMSLWSPTSLLWPISQWLFAALANVVEWSANQQALSWTVASPGGWLVAATYATLLVVICASSRMRRRVAISAVAVAWCVGLAVPAFASRTENAQIHFLSVGHGLSVLVQSPSGQTLLYDCGSLGNPGRTGLQISDALLALGVHRIDHLILSHADQDHFGAIEIILETFPIGSASCHPTFLESASWTVREAVTAIETAAIPLANLSAGDVIDLGPMRCRTLHPPREFASEEDNANSLVVALDFAGRSVLLTGDVEGDGLEHLLRTESPRPDIVLAPHHGSRDANTHEFAAWADAKAIIVSTGHDHSDFLSDVYESTPLFETSQDGAVTVEIAPAGQITLRGFRGRIAEISPNDAP